MTYANDNTIFQGSSLQGDELIYSPKSPRTLFRFSSFEFSYLPSIYYF